MCSYFPRNALPLWPNSNIVSIFIVIEDDSVVFCCILDMGIVDASNSSVKAEPIYQDLNGDEVVDFGQHVDSMFTKVDKVC